ncbi:MAG: hypothetical protein ACLSVD_04245 [Eggerthellaceae bacterium]
MPWAIPHGSYACNTAPVVGPPSTVTRKTSPTTNWTPLSARHRARHLRVHLHRRRAIIAQRDLIALCEAHSDYSFLSFTNATLIDESFAKICCA